jgi:predicted flavoprotein YhiN
MTWADCNKKTLQSLAQKLSDYSLEVKGKSTFKDEFVTAGGVDLKDIQFKTMESKLLPRMYFAGEVINVDALTGGFNFQAAWSESWIIAQSI